ncbi:PorT family protein [Elizabethkingia meningoseptica]|uniref:porin family protein n=1 Tax=Elizabethkingia meningoseptica TaxID=238 RepID=UPI0022F18C29|nr:porin family protein [Elizabethkingia meningoseptica]EJK5328959.1 PorT family protein [Elizabethkingia meningoseptica]MDE5467526.1 PorT family protein [Elizabethkingia meningoseptica]MDE5474445.1 PorT family protein [Elizabethkingia meningoseptica]MDE5477878.1 PorT family protein [Elizabethkingia meningoseptica]MDE5485785.1 PorT family protein [Elizabethkingia meningoseptica]
MKKVFLGLGIVLGTMAFAQTAGPRFGIKAGGNLSDLTNQSSLGEKSKIGFYAGVFMNAPISSDFSIQPEVVYSQQGAKYKDNILGLEKRNLGYINVPVMVQYNATPEFYLEAGPEFGFLVDAQTTIGNSKFTGTDPYNTFNFGVGLGAGYRFTPNIGINARYTAGFTNTLKNNNGDSVKNNNFQLGLAYTF